MKYTSEKTKIAKGRETLNRKYVHRRTKKAKKEDET